MSLWKNCFPARCSSGIEGLKHGLNIWLYQYNYRTPWAKECTSIELADDMNNAGIKQALVVGDENAEPNLDFLQPVASFVNSLDTPIEVLYLQDGKRGPKTSMGVVRPGDSLSVNTHWAHQFMVTRTDGPDETFTMTDEHHQRYEISKKTRRGWFSGYSDVLDEEL
eukprot:gnl/TRDRNA2_/TRDRNA2_170042_c0_seq1.p1 gnl/TRDRNA2_/TRDRNA2_170042_c0~~gnl/TRDRNA2_/TRDRNA2_170042_c0_seq1.p1  ORF type:complete len:166 (+),score=16.63 gnl/TRDRNA2_/TRDRNA2_170042_c0_seq1:169-666(+)